jgi:hypothetical protein
MNNSAPPHCCPPRQLRARSTLRLKTQPQIAENEGAADSSPHSQTKRIQLDLKAKTPALPQGVRERAVSIAHLDRKGEGGTTVASLMRLQPRPGNPNPPTLKESPLMVNQKAKSGPFW